MPGLHHVTAITSDAQKNVDFYAGTLALRLVKVTVNFDDPGSHHLYYGDELGRPGSAMTFFAWPGASRGRVGQPQATATAFSVPADALPFWEKRLDDASITSTAFTRFGDRGLAFVDFDGTSLELIATATDAREPWTKGGVSIDHAIRGFHSVTLGVEGYENTAAVLAAQMNFQHTAEESGRRRFTTAGGVPGAIVDIVCQPGARRGTLGAGVVHHVAFRANDDADHARWRTRLIAAGLNVSPVMERFYFHSIYFREPGGVLFEIATDNPGFTADEPATTLGEKLQLPPWMEEHRATIEASLVKLTRP